MYRDYSLTLNDKHKRTSDFEKYLKSIAMAFNLDPEVELSF